MNNQSSQQNEHGILETTAEAIGSTLGNLAVKTGIAKPPAPVEKPEPAMAAASQPQNQHPNRKARRANAKKKK